MTLSNKSILKIALQEPPASVENCTVLNNGRYLVKNKRACYTSFIKYIKSSTYLKNNKDLYASINVKNYKLIKSDLFPLLYPSIIKFNFKDMHLMSSMSFEEYELKVKHMYDEMMLYSKLLLNESKL
jgi:hypothetical protein